MTMNKIHEQLCDYKVDVPAEVSKPFTYVMAGNGLRLVRQNEIGMFIVPCVSVPGLKHIKEGFTMNLPKIPMSILFQIISFFKDVNKKNGHEASVFIYWDRDNKQYLLHVPEQEVTGASVNHKKDPEMERKYCFAMEIHSHNTMGAFWSGTDNSDEQAARIYGVIGEITKDIPEMKFRVKVGSESVDLKMEEVFDITTEYPKEWLDKVKEKKYEPVVVTTGDYVDYGRYSRYGNSCHDWNKYGHGYENNDCPEYPSLSEAAFKGIDKMLKEAGLKSSDIELAGTEIIVGDKAFIYDNHGECRSWKQIGKKKLKKLMKKGLIARPTILGGDKVDRIVNMISENLSPEEIDQVITELAYIYPSAEDIKEEKK